MRKVTPLASCALFFLFGTEPVLAGLDVGDPAPPLKIDQWIQGGPFSLEDGRGKSVYVVEFWATWCGPCRVSIPHLTEIQRKYKDRGVVVIGISDEPAATVKPFVAKMGGKFGYAVACDAERQTTKAYREAAGIGGIPHAFIVGKDGKIAWHAHPLDKLEQVLDAVLAGTFDAKAAKEKRDQVSKLRTRLQESTESQNWDDALAVVEELNKVDPDAGRYHFERLHYQVMKKDQAAAMVSAEAFLKAATDPMMLNDCAWGMLTDAAYGEPYYPLALRIAQKAYELTKGQDWSILDTYARAKFQTGSVAEAAKLQEHAIALAEKEGAGGALDELRKTLSTYRSAAQK